MLFEEHLDNVFTEGLTNASVGIHPPISQFVRIRPEEVADEPSVGHVRGPHDVAHLLEVVQLGRQTAVHAEDFLVDECSDRQVVEQICEQLPQFDVLPAFALVLETLNAVDRRTLMVAAQEEEILGLLAFVCHEDVDGFKRLLSAVDLIS